MKTTLKRQLTWRGSPNGRAIFPPAAWTPVCRYRQPERCPRGPLRLLGAVAGWTIVAAVVVAGGLAGGLYLRAHEFVAAISPHTRAARVAARHLNVVYPGRPTIALLLGSDFRRAGDPAAGGARSDTLMLIRSDPRTKSISMLSIPRDLLTTINCPGFPQHVDRINAAFAECGPLGSLLTVRALTGLPINYLITVNFRGFLQLVDRIGGIWLDVDQRYFNNHTGPGGYSAIDLHPGYQKLTALRALAFVRFRHTDSDIYRTARQQLFLRALEEQVSRSLSVSRLLDVVSAVEHNVTVGRAGGGGVTLRTLIDYLYFAYTLPRGHLLQARIQNFTGANTLSASQADIDAAVQQFVSPDVRAPAQAAVAAGIHLRRRPVQRSTAAPQTGSSIRSASVTANPGETLPTLRALQRRLPFRLMSPRLIERTSVPDPSEPVRQYTIVPGHQSVRLTFRAGAFDYWGIEETNWTDAPALNRPNLVRRFGRREFDLYYSGGQLRMVVLRRGATTYWVVNSLLNALSNNTMLAIARSLVPVQG